MERVDRPFVTLSYAQSLDGSIAIRRGEPLALSGTDSLQMTHQLRAEHDAILVGIGTVLSDDPQLTVRLVEGENPQPVILDSHLRFPVNARLLGNSKRPWIVTVEGSSDMDFPREDRRKMLESNGAKILPVPSTADGRVDLAEMLVVLSQHRIRSLMVEGGAQVITAFLRERFVDEVILTISPIFVGGLRSVEYLLSNPPFPRLVSQTIEPCGQDWIIRGKFPEIPIPNL